MAQVEPGIAETVIEGVARVAILPVRYGGGNFVERFRIEAEHFSNFARSHAAAIGNDVGGHGRAALTIAAIEILDYFFAIVTAWQIQIDVRPFATLFRKKALEKQFHAYRIDRGDAERIAGRAVGGRAASLHENVLLAAIA